MQPAHPSSLPQRGRIWIGPYLVDPVHGWIQHDAEQRRLDRRSLDVLLLLAREQGRVVAREEIIAEVWQGRFVSDAVLAKAVSVLRLALDDRRKDPKYIQTLRGEGYRLLAPVRTVPPRPALPPANRTPLGGWKKAVALPVVAALAAGALALALTLRPEPIDSPEESSGAGKELQNVSNFQPSWSPDGQWIAFVSDRDGGHELYLRKADGSELRRLTHTAFDEEEPGWSPDGRRLVFSMRQGDNWDIAVWELETGTMNRLTRDAAADFSPQWSPDGSTIVFTTTRDGNAELHAIRPDGSEPRNLTRHPGRDVGKVSFSPDGSQIAFASDRAAGRWAVYVMEQRGGEATRITYEEADTSCPRWSPDGRLLVYNRHRPERSDILALDLRSGATHHLLAGSRSFHLPSFSPAGDRLAYHVKRADGRDIYFLDLARRTATRLTWGRSS